MEDESRATGLKAQANTFIRYTYVYMVYGCNAVVVVQPGECRKISSNFINFAKAGAGRFATVAFVGLMHWTLRTFVLLSGIRLDEKELARRKGLLDRQVDRKMLADLPITPEQSPFGFLNCSHCRVCRLCLGQDNYGFGNIVQDCRQIDMGLLWCLINVPIFL